MIQRHTAPEKPGLLVSVRSVEEAMAAETSGCVSIIDVKEPRLGSLGCSDFATVSDICNVLSEETVKSIALGEACDAFAWESVSTTQTFGLLGRFTYVKTGLAGLASHSDWIDRWKSRLEVVPNAVCRVAVGYADFKTANAPSLHSVVQHAKEVGCSAFLIDTYRKGQGSLLEILSEQELRVVVEHARTEDLFVVLAGSLSSDNLVDAASYFPDFIAVRGAACETDRTSTISPMKIKELSQQIASTLQ